jgi:hypothetical protein
MDLALIELIGPLATLIGLPAKWQIKDSGHAKNSRCWKIQGPTIYCPDVLVYVDAHSSLPHLQCHKTMSLSVLCSLLK